jgi:N-acetyltransferase
MNTATEPWPPAVALEKNGIRLEPLTLAHEAGILAAAADGELWNIRVTSVPEPAQTRAYIEAALAARQTGERLPFAVIDMATGTLLGCTSYHDIVPAIKRVEIGWTWYRKSVQRSHVNTTCKLMLMQHAFETLGCFVVGWRTSHLNCASQRAIERLGAKRDGVIRHHAPHRDGTVRDTVIFSMLAAEWPEKKALLEASLSPRQPGGSGITRDATISLAEISAANGAIGERMVATNGISIAQGTYSPNAWMRAVMVGDTPVGFVMLFDPTRSLEAAQAEGAALDVLGVWRLMIDFKHQGKGFGEQAMQRIVEHAKAMPTINAVELSYVLREGNAKPFYERLGFVATGKVEHGEMTMRLSIR